MNTNLNKCDPRFRCPRVVRMVESYVGSRVLAVRYVFGAEAGDSMHLQIVREAFARRHKKQKGRS